MNEAAPIRDGAGPVPTPRSDSPGRLDRRDSESPELNFAGEDPAASVRGLNQPNLNSERPPHGHIRGVAITILAIFGLCLVLVLVLATVVAFKAPESLNFMTTFFGTIVATLGTLLGGVVAFYFSRK